MNCLQFTLRALLIGMLCAACFFAGMALQRRLDEPKWIDRPVRKVPNWIYTETIELRDGSR